MILNSIKGTKFKLDTKLKYIKYKLKGTKFKLSTKLKYIQYKLKGTKFNLIRGQFSEITQEDIDYFCGVLNDKENSGEDCSTAVVVFNDDDDDASEIDKYNVDWLNLGRGMYALLYCCTLLYIVHYCILCIVNW